MFSPYSGSGNAEAKLKPEKGASFFGITEQEAPWVASWRKLTWISSNKRLQNMLPRPDNNLREKLTDQIKRVKI